MLRWIKDKPIQDRICCICRNFSIPLKLANESSSNIFVYDQSFENDEFPKLLETNKKLATGFICWPEENEECTQDMLKNAKPLFIYFIERNKINLIEKICNMLPEDDLQAVIIKLKKIIN